MSIYAIGDVHGRADLLGALISAIENHEESDVDQKIFIFLGDIVDRGSDSRGAMDLVLRTIKRYPRSKLILGNHDFLFRQFAKGQMAEPAYLGWLFTQGGKQTIESYLPVLPTRVDDILDGLEMFHDHFSLLDEAVDSISMGGFCFVHAGIRPGVSLADQNEHDLRWIRDEFLEFPEPFEKIIVHGHTPVNGVHPEFRPNRIAVDTGAHETGSLSAVVINNDEAVGFLRAWSFGDEHPQTEFVSRVSITAGDVEREMVRNCPRPF
ncbi:metallophosphoesterase [Rhizobium leguminosarum]|uniref:metallophosphoesterase n=1 Tax=Rhizobium leguminosarum TaxID=384 RepID=UPI0013E2D722|nr:metallophosphoesterase [Rhizobium leguminosarum]